MKIDLNRQNRNVKVDDEAKVLLQYFELTLKRQPNVLNLDEYGSNASSETYHFGNQNLKAHFQGSMALSGMCITLKNDFHIVCTLQSTIYI